MTFARNTIAIAASLCLAIVLHTTASQAEEPSGHVAIPYQDAEFTPLMGGPAEIAILSGNPQTGPSSILLRFPPRYPGAMHSHSAGYHAIVIEGASKHWTENNDADSTPLQTPGDYWFQAGGQVHQDSFPSDEITTVFLRFEGPVDFFLAEK